MTSEEADEIERRYEDVKGIESETAGLKYFYDSKRTAIVIAGQKGCAYLTAKQAYVLARELKDVLEHIDLKRPNQKARKTG